MQVLSQFHDLILCIISALEARDPYTSHHSSRVADILSVILAVLVVIFSWNKIFED